jgi:hypothetical protein
MPMNSKWWKTILIESILSGAIWVVATCWPVDWRKANWKLMKTHWYIMIHNYTNMESKHADANRIFSLPGWFHVTQKAQTAFGWSGWSLLIWFDLWETRWNQMKQSYVSHNYYLMPCNVPWRCCWFACSKDLPWPSVRLTSPNLSPSSNKSEEQAASPTDEREWRIKMN